VCDTKRLRPPTHTRTGVTPAFGLIPEDKLQLPWEYAIGYLGRKFK